MKKLAFASLVMLVTAAFAAHEGSYKNPEDFWYDPDFQASEKQFQGDGVSNFDGEFSKGKSLWGRTLAENPKSCKAKNPQGNFVRFNAASERTLRIRRGGKDTDYKIIYALSGTADNESLIDLRLVPLSKYKTNKNNDANYLNYEKQADTDEQTPLSLMFDANGKALMQIEIPREVNDGDIISSVPVSVNLTVCE